VLDPSRRRLAGAGEVGGDGGLRLIEVVVARRALSSGRGGGRTCVRFFGSMCRQTSTHPDCAA
jgi:hypothetical protein